MLNRRDFLKALGIGAAVAAVPELIEPVKKLWFVGSTAPVGSRVERIVEYDPSQWPQWDPAKAGYDPGSSDSTCLITARLENGAYSFEGVEQWRLTDGARAQKRALLNEMTYGGQRGGGKTRMAARMEGEVNWGQVARRRRAVAERLGAGRQGVSWRWTPLRLWCQMTGHTTAPHATTTAPDAAVSCLSNLNRLAAPRLPTNPR